MTAWLTWEFSRISYLWLPIVSCPPTVDEPFFSIHLHCHTWHSSWPDCTQRPRNFIFSANPLLLLSSSHLTLVAHIICIHVDGIDFVKFSILFLWSHHWCMESCRVVYVTHVCPIVASCTAILSSDINAAMIQSLVHLRGRFRGREVRWTSACKGKGEDPRWPRNETNTLHAVSPLQPLQPGIVAWRWMQRDGCLC